MAGPTTNRIGGVLSFVIDGQQYEARGNFQVRPSSVKRTGVAGQDSVHGYIEEPVVPSIKGDISIGGGPNAVSFEDLEQITDSTIQVSLANGRTYVLTQGWYDSDATIDTHDGKAEVTFEGITCEEL
jgi:hypothetical protein